MTINISKNQIIYFLSLILFLVYLIKANTLLSLTLGNSIKEVDFERFNKNNRVFWSVDDIVIYNDLKEKVNISGWAFCNTEIDNDNKSISIILKSSDKVYAYSPIHVERSDISGIFKDTNKIRGDMHGYDGEFSTITIENGIYELYLYCYENEENFGLVNTNIMLEKSGANFSEYIRISHKTEILKDNLSTEKTDSFIDYFKVIENGFVNIGGWAFVEGLNTDNQQVYVEITDTMGKTLTYDTRTISRDDVGEVFKSDAYNQSGFEAIIKESELRQEELIITIYIENEGRFYEAKKFLNDANGVHEYIWSTEQENINKDGLSKVDAEIALDELQILEDDSMIIAGWTFVNGLETDSQNVYVEITDSRGKTALYDTKSVTRYDVGEIFESNMYNHSGFEAIIREGEFKQDDLIIVIYIENERGLYEARRYLKDASGIKEYIWSTQRANITKVDFSKKGIENSIDALQLLEDGSIAIVGWAFVEGLETVSQKVYLEITDSLGKTLTYTTKSVSREDVGDAYESNVYNQSGFEATIRNGELKKGDLIVKIYIENEGHFFESKLYSFVVE